jgi:Ca2+-binding RTX toxin-like protein
LATYTGTTGNDLLTGTSADDLFLPLVGQDTVTGGAGFDSLILDWSTLTANGGNGTISASGGAFSGSITAGNGNASSILFSQVEALNLILTAGGDTLAVDLAPLALGATATINGGGGWDILKADFRAFASTTFTQGVNFIIGSNHGTFAGFEQFDLSLGNGSNVVTLQGSGADVIRSTGGIDQIDGGAGHDLWYADFSSYSSNISFGWDGDRNLAAVSNGTNVQRVEGGAIIGGSGDDAFFLNGTNPFAVDGGVGRDMLIWDESGLYTASYSAIFSDGAAYGLAGTFTGSIRGSTFTAIEQINVALSDGDNLAYVDTAPLAQGATMNIDGGLGNDTLQVEFSSFANTSFYVDGSGTAVTSHGIYGGFENFTMALGIGTNTVTTAGGNDIVYSLGGTDTIDAWAGFDFWGGDWSDHAEPITFAWNGTTGSAMLTVGAATTTLTNFETGYLNGGSGNDNFALSGLMPFDVTGGAGFDTLTRNDAGLTGANATSTILSGGAWFLGWLGNGQFDGIEAIVATLGDGNDSVFVDASPLSSGATLNLDGGGGTDALLIDFSALAGTQFVAGSSSNRGTFTNFEVYAIALGAGTNTVTTGAGDDTVEASLGGVSTIETGAGDDQIWGGVGTQAVNGGSGTDHFHITGTAADFSIARDNLGGYYVADINLANGDQGTDHLTGVEWIDFTDTSLALAPYTPGITFTGTSGADSITGTTYDDTLLGLAGNDLLDGGAGSDTINPGAGNDTITGGTEIDTLAYDDATAAVKISLAITGKAQATGGSGSDWLVDAFENLIGSALNDTLTGNALNNVITGNAGNDRIDGGAGADTLIGGLGNDTYLVDNAADHTIENTAEGTDLVLATVTWTLAANIENLTLSGTTAINGTGNALANVLAANAASNHLWGLDGNDTLNGGGGADILEGGLGNDTYVVDNSSDVVIEQAGEGTDIVQASASYTLSANVEKLTLTGTGTIDGTGNTLANTLTGNAANNALWGLAGNDVISGAAGDDLLVGGLGADTLTGGAGSDTFRFDVKEAAANKDTIKDFTHGADRLELVRTAFTAFATDTAGALNPDEFGLGTAATTVHQHLIYNQVTGALYYDADGAGGSAQLQIALLSTKPVLDATDIFLL